MKEDDYLYSTLLKIANHPLTFGFSAGVVRFIIGDRQAGWKALMTNIVLSMFVAFCAMVYLLDEPYTEGKKAFFTVIASLLARDLLIATLAIGGQVRKDPMGFLLRLREAFKGGAK